MNRLVLELGIGLVLVLSLALVGQQWKAERKERVRLEQLAKTEKVNEVIVEKFIDRKVEVVKHVPVIRERLVERVCHTLELPSARDSPAAPGTQAGDGVVDGLATEIGACLVESAQLSAIIESLRKQGVNK